MDPVNTSEPMICRQMAIKQMCSLMMEFLDLCSAEMFIMQLMFALMMESCFAGMLIVQVFQETWTYRLLTRGKSLVKTSVQFNLKMVNLIACHAMEPSFARTSEIGEIVEPSGLRETPSDNTGLGNAFTDTATAVQIASRSLPSPSVEPVWEQGIWGVIFGNKTMLDVCGTFGQSLKRPLDTSHAINAEDAAMPSTLKKVSKDSGLSFGDVVMDKPAIPWQEQREADLQSTVKLWMALVDRWDPECSLSKSMESLHSTARVFTMLAHLFAGRSPVTIRKRAYSIMRLCDYLDEFSLTFPCTERVFYDFLCCELNRSAPQSRMKGYMQALNFVLHVMSVDELKGITDSSRCKGACLQEYMKERVQASPLRVSELRHFHSLLFTSDDLWVQLFCGAVLMTVYCRARWGDLMRAECIVIDRDRDGKLMYLEARTGRHKTMRSQMHRHQFLPMVAPVHGIDKRDWGSQWLHVRELLNVPMPPEGLVMPAPDRQGNATCRPLETQECSAWLKKIVSAISSVGDRRISSHSMKSTFLSYAAKRGIGIPERLQLGYHTSSFQMGMVYSRDGAAASIMVLEKLIEEIAQDRFDPDDTRSGRLHVEEVSEQHGDKNQVIEVKDEPEVIEDSDSDSSVSSSSTSSEEPRPQRVKVSRLFTPAQAPEGFALWQHDKLKTLHLMDNTNRKVFTCGRMAGTFHKKLSVAPQFDAPLCSSCFNRDKLQM